MAQKNDVLVIFMAAQLANPVLHDRPMADLAKRAAEAVEAISNLDSEDDDEGSDPEDRGTKDP